jgi:phosphopantothenoylcysteine decarboxylase/phosphopantothenate--cysteine ligase
VYADVFSRDMPWDVAHVSSAKWGDAFVVSPATANIIGKLAHGIGDDAPTTLYLAFPGVTFIAPAMHTEMWERPATRENVKILKKRGVRFIGPEQGELACGDTGLGRMSAPEAILEEVKRFFLSQRSLEGKRALVTAGPTREQIDPIRFLSNRSSGKMGYALAEAAAARGAQVTLVSGPTALDAPSEVLLKNVTSAEEMLKEVLSQCDKTDIFIFAAAVSDFRPEKTAAGKIKKGSAGLILKLALNPDIAAEIGSSARADQFLVGFAAETENLKKYALKKLKEKNLDLIIANDVSRKDSGMESDKNSVMIFSRKGLIEETGALDKRILAEKIMDIITSSLERKRSG